MNNHFSGLSLSLLFLLFSFWTDRFSSEKAIQLKSPGGLSAASGVNVPALMVLFFCDPDPACVQCLFHSLPPIHVCRAGVKSPHRGSFV